MVREMNSTQWTFEYLSYIEEKDKHYEEIETLARLFRSAAINLLGLNIVPVEETDERTGTVRLRAPEDHEITPLSTLLASPELLQEIMKKHEELATQQQVDAELEREEDIQTPEDIDKQLGDIEFLEDTETLLKKAAWDSPHAKELRRLFISDAEDQPSIDAMLKDPDDRNKQQMKEAKKFQRAKLVID